MIFWEACTTTASSYNLLFLLDLLGIGMFHYVGLIITGIYFMADSMEMSLLLFLAVTIKGEWELLAGESATITSLVFWVRSVVRCFGVAVWYFSIEKQQMHKIFYCYILMRLRISGGY